MSSDATPAPLREHLLGLVVWATNCLYLHQLKATVHQPGCPALAGAGRLHALAEAGLQALASDEAPAQAAAAAALLPIYYTFAKSSHFMPLPEPTRAQHLQWAKDRAEEYLAKGELAAAWASFSTDLLKHEETRHHVGLTLGMGRILGGDLGTAEQLRQFIQEFN